MKLDWNRERYRTRDLLLEYDTAIMPARPRTAGLAMVYPWENLTLSTLKAQIIEIARQSGYNGSDEDFWNHFSNFSGEVHTGTLATFPTPGKETDLYLDTETNILYYFKIVNNNINTEALILAGAEVVGTSDEATYLYIPVRALPIEPLLLDCGSSTELVD